MERSNKNAVRNIVIGVTIFVGFALFITYGPIENKGPIICGRYNACETASNYSWSELAILLPMEIVASILSIWMVWLGVKHFVSSKENIIAKLIMSIAVILIVLAWLVIRY